MRNGMDVSHHQGVIDWSLVKRSGFDFVIMKATEGADWVDSKLVTNGYGVRAQRMTAQYYHYGRPDNAGQNYIGRARAEANHFLVTLSGVPAPKTIRFDSGRTAAVWFDLEADAGNLSKEECLDWMLEWFAVVEDYYPAGLYVSKRWLEENAVDSQLDVERLLTRGDGSQRAYWVARYGTNTGRPHPEYDPNEKVPAAFGTWDIWQYTSKGSVSGIQGDVDLNLSRY